jgi:hypothetical protein
MPPKLILEEKGAAKEVITNFTTVGKDYEVLWGV